MRRLTITTILAAAVALLSVNNLAAQQVTIPEGTIIELRMDTALNSDTSHVNDAFKASVLRSVSIDGRIAVPENSSVTGRVSTVQPAERSSRSGVIGVEFNQITINGRAYPITGTLTSLNSDERRQIIDQESRVTGSSSTQRNTLFIGGGAGAGAVIGALADGGKGAGIGALTGGGIGVLGALFSKGAEAQVPAGTAVAMQVVRAFNVTPPAAPRQTQGAGSGAGNTRGIYTSSAMVSGAQTALRNKRYYDGVTTGRLDITTRHAIAHYQIDNNQPATGDLDDATAASLGLVRSGSTNADNALRQRAADIHQKATALLNTYQTRTGVRVDNIRARQISEQDLDLLLQLDAFVQAATWYDQASTGTAPLSVTFDNLGRILVRSGDRVDYSMKEASQDRQFATDWASIQTILRGIR